MAVNAKTHTWSKYIEYYEILIHHLDISAIALPARLMELCKKRRWGRNVVIARHQGGPQPNTIFWISLQS